MNFNTNILIVKNKIIQDAEDIKPKYTSGSVRFHPRVNILLSDVVAIVSGKMLLIYCNKIGIPSTGQITPEKEIYTNIINLPPLRKFNKKYLIYQRCKIV